MYNDKSPSKHNLNVCTSSNEASNYGGGGSNKIKEEIIVGDFNTPLLVINKKIKIKFARKNHKVTPQPSGSN